MKWEATFIIEDGSSDAIKALFGPPIDTYKVTLNIPARRRTFWEWLTRKPKHVTQTIVIPHARLASQGQIDKEPTND